MFQIDPLSLIPDSLKTAVRDAAVDFVSDQAKKFLGEELGSKIKKLRSDAAFAQKFEKGLQKALQRFVDEYAEQDEDLVAAISADASVFKNEQVQKALLEMLKNPGKYLADEQETIAEGFATVLPGRKNRERVDKAMTFLLRCLAEEMWNLPELQPIYNLQFQKMTAESMRQQVDLQKAQLQALTTVNEGVRQALLQLTDAIAEKKLLPAPDGQVTPVRPKVLHNLPQPDYERFIGREKELKHLMDLLNSKSRHFLISIDGVGGVGKSSLALEIATYFLQNISDLEKSEQFDAIIWVSAKKTVLTPDGVISRSQTHRTLDDIYQTISVVLDNEAIKKSPADQQNAVVRDALSKQRTLLIIDNFETIDDEKVVSFLLDLPFPTKALITTRTRVGASNSLSLTGMHRDEAFDFINQECVKKQVELQQGQKQRLFDRTGGIPLAMSWCIAQMGMGYPVESVLTRLGRSNSDVALFSFRGSLDIVQSDPIAYDLLLSLSLFASTASRESLGIIAGCDENFLDRDDGLAKLEKMSLINSYQGRFSMLPLTKEFVASEFRNYPEREVLLSKWKDWVVAYVMENGGEGWDWRGFQKINLEIDNIVGMIEQGIENDWKESLVVLRYITYYMKISGRWNESNRQSENALFLARKLNDHKAVAMIATHSLGWTYAQQGNLDKAKSFALKGLDASMKDGDLYSIASSKRVLGQIYRKQDEYLKAKICYDEALELAIKINDLGLKGNLIGEQGKLAIDQGNYLEGRQMLTMALEILDSREEDRLIYGALSGHLANLNYITGNLDDAELFGLKCLSIFDEIGGVSDVTLTLARIYKQQGKIEESRSMCYRSIDLFEKLGMPKELEQTKSLLATLN
jgi:LuxR family glucitol operon transcriptional activator